MEVTSWLTSVTKAQVSVENYQPAKRFCELVDMGVAGNVYRTLPDKQSDAEKSISPYRPALPRP